MALVGREDTHTLHDDWILQFNYLSTEFSVRINKCVARITPAVSVNVISVNP